jgi:3-oxoacyl-[acyl-carrier-protein] synthase II
MDTFIHYGLARDPGGRDAACRPATRSTRTPSASACLVGSGIGGLPLIEDTHTRADNRGPRRISPFFVPASIINMISGHVSIQFGFKGPNLAIVTACTTGCTHRRWRAA